MQKQGSCPEQPYSFFENVSSLVCFLKDLFYKMHQDSTAENAFVRVVVPAFLGILRAQRPCHGQELPFMSISSVAESPSS